MVLRCVYERIFQFFKRVCIMILYRKMVEFPNEIVLILQEYADMMPSELPKKLPLRKPPLEATSWMAVYYTTWAGRYTFLLANWDRSCWRKHMILSGLITLKKREHLLWFHDPFIGLRWRMMCRLKWNHDWYVRWTRQSEKRKQVCYILYLSSKNIAVSINGFHYWIP